jgi:hypothetical protein
VVCVSQLQRPRKNPNFVIPFTVNVLGEPRRAFRRGISLFLSLNPREIPHFVRNDKINCFFRGGFSRDMALSGSKGLAPGFAP